jgi:hypothetical protein
LPFKISNAVAAFYSEIIVLIPISGYTKTCAVASMLYIFPTTTCKPCEIKLLKIYSE